MLKFAQLAGAADVPVTVTVNAPVPTLELASKTTSSADVGALAPLAPPEDAAQFVVVVASQLPEPPTQYLVAIHNFLYRSHNRIPIVKAFLLHL